MGKERTQRIFRKAWREMLGLVIAALGWVLNFGWLPSTLLTIVGIAIWGIYAYQRSYDYEEKIDTFENSRPKLVPSPITGVFDINPLVIENYLYYANQTTSSENDNVIYGSPGIGETPNTFRLDHEKDNQVWFAFVTFHNKPIESTETSVAKDVSATITYYDRNCNLKLGIPEIPGRWWSNPEVARSNKSRRELERTDIYPGPQGAILALACMGTKESAIYAYNNESHNDKNFKKQEFALGLQSYNIRVVLAGINLNETEFWLSIWRDRGSEELKVKIIEKPDCIK